MNEPIVGETTSMVSYDLKSDYRRNYLYDFHIFKISFDLILGIYFGVLTPDFYITNMLPLFHVFAHVQF